MAMGIFVSVLSFMKEAKKAVAESILAKLLASKKAEEFTHIFKIFKLVACKTDYKQILINFFHLKSANEGYISFKTQVFSFMREFKGEVESDCITALGEQTSFEKIIDQLRTFGENPNGEFSGVTKNSIKEFIQLYITTQ